MTGENTELERLCDCITLLKQAPHTASQMAAKLSVKPAAARRWMNVFEYKGHAVSLPVLVNGQAMKAWRWA